MNELPKRFEKFRKDFPEVSEAQEELGKEVHQAGPLDDKSRALIKLAISTGARLEGAVHSHTGKALEAGCSKEEILQTVMLALPTIGLPSTMAALSWVEDVLEKK